jgi:hypothetical protein
VSTHRSVGLVVLSLARPGETRVLYEAGPGKEFYGIFTPADAGRGRVACIAASGPNRRILVFDAASGSRSALSLPEGVAFPRYLHAAYTGDGIRVSLGWCGHEYLYRAAATWDPEAGTIALQPPTDREGYSSPSRERKPRPHDSIRRSLSPIERISERSMPPRGRPKPADARPRRHS